jgi:hypothetical protein
MINYLETNLPPSTIYNNIIYQTIYNKVQNPKQPTTLNPQP